MTAPTPFAPGKHAAHDYPDHLQLEADVAIIGAGAGGSAAAAAMAERGLKVVVLEEGRHWQPSEFEQNSVFALRNLYQDRGTRVARGNAVIPMPGGRGVGGSTLINSAICFRAPDAILDDWREAKGVDTITRERFHDYFDRIWETIGVTTQSAEIQRLNNTVFKKGAEKLGLKGSFLPRSAPGCVGCGICQYGCPTGGKASVDRTFLAEAVQTGNVGVYADCRMREAVRIGDRVTAIRGEWLDPDAQTPKGTIEVRAETFLIAGGPVGTPLFLQANGLSDSKHVGRHLVVHPTIGALARFPFEILPWRGVTQGYYVDMWDYGYLLQTYSVTPDQYFMVMPTAGDTAMAWMKDLANIGSAGALVHDEDSEGYVQYTPLGPDIGYTLGDGDRRRLLEGLRMTSLVFFAAGAESVLTMRAGATPITSERDIDAAIPLDLPPTHMTLYASHPMGTARMSARAEDGVVDPHGRIWGLKNVRVADASVFPTSLGVNPQVTTMAIGLMVGHSIAAS